MLDDAPLGVEVAQARTGDVEAAGHDHVVGHRQQQGTAGRVGVPVAQPVSDAMRRASTTTLLQGAEAENRQKLWRWFLVATLIVLLFESVLAGWTARLANLKPEEATP